MIDRHPRPDPTPRAIRLLADYDCWPLWEASPGRVDNIDPAHLPISEALGRDLAAWADRFDAILNRDDPAASGFDSPEQAAVFTADGVALAARLRLELGRGWSVEHRE